jgi:hypothetical protein
VRFDLVNSRAAHLQAMRPAAGIPQNHWETDVC